MADLRIVDAPEIPTNSITGEEKLPTGGSGNYSISLDSLAEYTKTKKDLADNTSVDNKVNGVRQELDAHTQDSTNPHQVTKGQIGLGNVDNTADLDKPVSNSTQAAIISAVAPKADKTYVDNALSSKSDKTYVDNQLTLKANKSDVYTKAETYTKQESSYLVNNSISTALTPVNASLDLAKRGIANRYDSSLTYNSGERVVLANGDIVKSGIDGNVNDPNVSMIGWRFDDNTVKSIADLITIPNPKNGSRVYVKAYRSGWAAEAIYHGPKGGGMFAYNSTKATVNDGIHCFNGWERVDYDKYYVNTDIAGFYGDGVNDDFESFMRVNRYIITLDFWTPKTFEMMQGNFLISSFTDECIIVPEYGLTTLVTVTGNMTIKGQGKKETKITYDFDYLAWMYTKFTTNYELNVGIVSNPLHCTFSPNKNYVSQIIGINIESFSVDLKGDVYYYNQIQADKAQNEGKAFCSISPISWSLNTIQDIKITDLKTIRNPSMQNIAFNNSQAYTDNVLIHGTEHEYCGEASSLLNKCHDHSSIYCSGKYSKVTGSKFTSSRASTINCAIEFHGSGEVSGNEFIDCAAPLYFVNLQGYQGGTFNEYFDNTKVTVKNNKVSGAIYGIGYANGGKMTLNIENNNIKLRKEKANSTWVNGKVYVHGGLDARGLINLNQTVNSYTKVTGSGNTFEQEEPTGWTTEDNYINSCIATKNIQELNWFDNVFINFKGSALVLEKPIAGGTIPKIRLSKNTYINCGSNQDVIKSYFVTDSVVYISNADILDFSGAVSNVSYGDIVIEDETYINCKYKRVVTQYILSALFASAKVNINCQGTFLTPTSFVNAPAGTDSFTNYDFYLNFGRVVPSIYGMGVLLKGHKFTMEYEYIIPSTERLYRNTCIKLDQANSFSTVSQAFNTLSVVSGDVPNGISKSDRDAVYFPLNRSNEVQKLNYNSSTSSWS